MHWLLFWMLNPGDNRITDEDWSQYLDALVWEYLLWVVASVFVICILYMICTRRLKFADLRRPFWPMWLLVLAVVPGTAVGLRASVLFDTFDGLNGKQGAVSSGISSAFWTTGIVLGLTWVGFAFGPRVTPPMFKFKPRAWYIAIRKKLKG
jgi:uncharacterized membrane protein YhaH (DUF805 family)